MDIRLRLLLSLTLLCSVLVEDAGAYSAGPPLDACITRLPGHTGYQAQTGACPYSIQARDWIPGRGTTMLLQKEATVSTSPSDSRFKGFLVSVQHPNGTLIGSMSMNGISPDTAAVESACVDTSLSHSDSTPKDFVVFDWTAPADLDLTTEVIVRLTVVESFETFYVDCNPLFLGVDPNYLMSTTQTTTTPTTTTQTTTTPTTTTPTTTTQTTTTPTTTTQTTTTPTTTTQTTTTPTTTTQTTTTPTATTHTTTTPTTTTQTTTQTTTKPTTTSQTTTTPTTTTQTTTTPTTTTQTTTTPTTTTPTTTTQTTTTPTTTTQTTTTPTTTTQTTTTPTTTTQTTTTPTTTTHTTTTPTTTTQTTTTTPTTTTQTTTTPTTTTQTTTTQTTTRPTTTTQVTTTPTTTTPSTTTPRSTTPKTTTQATATPTTATVKTTTPTTTIPSNYKSSEKPSTNKATHKPFPVTRVQQNTTPKPSANTKAADSDQLVTYKQGEKVMTALVENAEGTSSHREPLPHLKHTIVSEFACDEAGNHFRIVPNTNCRQYIQSLQIPALNAGQEYVRSCPSVLVFDPVQCTCNWPNVALCPNSVR